MIARIEACAPDARHLPLASKPFELHAIGAESVRRVAQLPMHARATDTQGAISPLWCWARDVGLCGANLLALLRRQMPTGCSDVKKRLCELPQAEASRLAGGGHWAQSYRLLQPAHLSLCLELHQLLGDIRTPGILGRRKRPLHCLGRHITREGEATEGGADVAVLRQECSLSRR